MNDLRIPIGLYFAIIGIVLVIAGIAVDYRAELTSVNINLYSGISMLLFGSVMLYSTVPLGSGLSSSASLEVSSALALGWPVSDPPSLELAKLCQAAENRFVGLPSGIMDQYVSVFGREHAAIRIDCRSLESE